MKKPVFAALITGFVFQTHMKASFQRYLKTKPGTIVPGFFICRGEKTRTSGLYVPNVARYQLRHTPKQLRWQK
jgi:hypothetical protein